MKTDEIVEILKKYIPKNDKWNEKMYHLQCKNIANEIHSLYTPDISEEEIQKAVFDYNGLSDKTMLRWPIPENAPLNKAFYDGIQWALSKTRNETPPKDGAKEVGGIKVKKDRNGFIRIIFPENDIRFMQDYGFWQHIPSRVKFVAELTGNDSVRLIGEGYGALRENKYGLSYNYGNGAIYVLLSDLPDEIVTTIKELNNK